MKKIWQIKSQREAETSRKADEKLRASEVFEAKAIALVSPVVRHYNAHEQSRFSPISLDRSRAS